MENLATDLIATKKIKPNTPDNKIRQTLTSAFTYISPTLKHDGRPFNKQKLVFKGSRVVWVDNYVVIHIKETEIVIISHRDVDNTLTSSESEKFYVANYKATRTLR
jgi:hypothetical protein